MVISPPVKMRPRFCLPRRRHSADEAGGQDHGDVQPQAHRGAHAAHHGLSRGRRQARREVSRAGQAGNATMCGVSAADGDVQRILITYSFLSA